MKEITSSRQKDHVIKEKLAKRGIVFELETIIKRI